MLFAFICKDKPGILQVRLDNRPAHVAFLEKLNAEGTLKIRRAVPRRRRQAVRQPGGDRGGGQGGGRGDRSPRIPTPRPACSRRPRSSQWNWTFNKPAGIWSGGARCNYWLFKSEPDRVFLGEAEEQGQGRHRNGTACATMRRATTCAPCRSATSASSTIPTRGSTWSASSRCASSRIRDSTTDDARWECVDIRAVKDVPNAADAERDQGQSEARRNGAGQARPAFGAAGDARPNGRKSAAWAGSTRRPERRAAGTADAGQCRGVHPRQHGADGAAACAGNLRCISPTRRMICG